MDSVPDAEVDEAPSGPSVDRSEPEGKDKTEHTAEPEPEGETEHTVEPEPEAKNSQEDKEDDEEGVECGFLVDRITTMPYQKATERGEVPFCAFSPISTQDLYLLRIQECSDKTRHMLVPACKEDVFSTPGALKTMDDDQEPGNEESMNYRVAIVAIARQIYSDEDKQLVVSVDPLLKKDKKKIQMVKFLTLDKFADFAFLGFDGNVSEFVNNNNKEDNPKENNVNSNGQQNQNGSKQPSGDDKNVLSTPAVPNAVKSPPKAPARRGRGGRRRMSRKSPPTTSPKHGQTVPPQPQPHSAHYFPANFQQLSHDLPRDFTQALIKMEHGESETQHLSANFISQGFQIPISQVADPSIFTQESFVIPSRDVPPMLQVPTPVSEVTVCTTEPGAEAGAQQTNHDLITIAFDQLVGMSSEVSSTDAPVTEKSSRGGRRPGPGRKPGRKPLKDRHPNQVDTMDDNAMFGHLTASDETPAAPKRRGRPPKNRVQLQFPSVENENSNPTIDGEVRDDLENYEKRMKLQIPD